MMTTTRRNTNLDRSLVVRIREAEQRLVERRRSVSDRGSRLRHSFHERMTSPALLGATAGMGFLLGQLTQGSSGSGRSWSRIAVSSMPWMHTVFKALKPDVPSPVSSPADIPG